MDYLKKHINIKLGYYSKPTGVTEEQLEKIDKLLEEKGYHDAYNKYILKHGLRNPKKRITYKNALKLIEALENNNSITFLDKE
jgi:hypothetical protein